MNSWHDITPEFDKVPLITFGRHMSYNLRNDPKRLLFQLSRYKFAANMIKPDSDILELGCSEGMAVPMLRGVINLYRGVDLDDDAIMHAISQYDIGDPVIFNVGDILNLHEYAYKDSDAVISFDVIEHIQRDREDDLLNAIHSNLKPSGIAIIGTPNACAAEYASPLSKKGHINLYTAGQLSKMLSRIFEHVQIFSQNDEMIHTGYVSMAHYLIALCCGRRDKWE